MSKGTPTKQKKMAQNTLAKKYVNYSSQTQKFMIEVEAFLRKKYTELQPHWEGQLQLLATNYDLFIKAKGQVNEDGLLVQNRMGGWDKHPLLATIKDSNIQVIKLINEFGLSPSSNGKIKEKSDDNDFDLINGLING